VKRAFQIGIAIIGLCVFVFAVRHLDLHALFASLRTMNPALALVAMVVVLVGKVGSKALRSQRLLETECRRAGCAAPTLATTTRLLLASHAAGQLAWGPLGFTVRTVALQAKGMPIKAVARVHVAERIAEACGLVAVALVAVAPLGPLQLVASTLALVLLVDLVLISFGFSLARATAWAFASSVADLAVLFLASHAMHVDVSLAPILLAFLAINAAYLLPTPGQLGVQEAAITVAFAAAGIAAPEALACALAYRCVHLVALGLVGVPALIATWLPQRRPVTV
jgi:hypothetical protein